MYQPLFIAIGLTLAVSPSSQALGGKKQRIARQVLRMGIWMAVLYGLLTIIPMWYETILLWLRQDPAIAEHASVYLRLMGLACHSFMFVFAELYLCLSKPISPVIITCIGLVINICLNQIFAMGLFGSTGNGISRDWAGTAITFILMVFMLALYMITNRQIGRTRPFGRLFRFNPLS